MTTLDFINKLFSAGVILGQMAAVLAVAYLLFFHKTKNAITDFIGKYGLWLAFAIALIAMCGSLFYSQIAGFTPCDLCWFQRIFMYPLVFLLGLALIKGDAKIADYGITLAVIGGLISVYHNYIYYYNGGLNVFCQLGGMQVSCIKRYVFEFGYVTIPLMALTAFALIIIFLFFFKQANNTHARNI